MENNCWNYYAQICMWLCPFPSVLQEIKEVIQNMFIDNWNSCHLLSFRSINVMRVFQRSTLVCPNRSKPCISHHLKLLLNLKFLFYRFCFPCHLWPIDQKTSMKQNDMEPNRDLLEMLYIKCLDTKRNMAIQLTELAGRQPWGHYSDIIIESKLSLIISDSATNLAAYDLCE